MKNTSSIPLIVEKVGLSSFERSRTQIPNNPSEIIEKVSEPKVNKKMK